MLKQALGFRKQSDLKGFFLITPVAFIVLGPDWPDYYPDLVLGMPWFQENGATLDICNSKLLLDNNFATPFKEVK